jgi:hypothetical protein
MLHQGDIETSFYEGEVSVFETYRRKQQTALRAANNRAEIRNSTIGAVPLKMTQQPYSKTA